MLESVWDGSRKHTYLAALQGICPYQPVTHEAEGWESWLPLEGVVLDALRHADRPLTRQRLAETSHRSYREVIQALDVLVSSGVVAPVDPMAVASPVRRGACYRVVGEGS